MDTLDFIVKRFNIDLSINDMPIEIPDFGRNNLAVLFKDLGFKTGVEVGVENGIYSEILCKSNPELKLYGIDPWLQNPVDRIYNKAVQRLRPYNVILIRQLSLDAVKSFPNNSIDFVYIDGNHDFYYCINDIVEWNKKVRPGGIISGHDYVNYSAPNTWDVVGAVKSFVLDNNIKPWFILGTHEVIPGIIRDKPRSFMWIKS